MWEVGRYGMGVELRLILDGFGEVVFRVGLLKSWGRYCGEVGFFFLICL